MRAGRERGLRGKGSFVFLCLLLVLGVWGTEGSTEEPGVKDRETLRALLPEDGEVSGLKGVTGPDFYVPENLFDYMDGQAEMYLDYGFVLLVTREYRSADGSPVNVEIYQMAGPTQAFGIYAAERTPEDRSVEIGAEGYLGTNVLGFWKGPYYIKILCFQTSPATESLLEKTGTALAEKIQGTYSRPALFSVFPEEFRVKGSERFIPKNFLGQAFLKNGYRVDYERERRSYQIFLLQEGSEEEAQGLLQRYQDFHQSQGSRISRSNRGNYTIIQVEGEKPEALFQLGSFWGGVLGTKDLQEAEFIVREMVERLKTWKEGRVTGENAAGP